MRVLKKILIVSSLPVFMLVLSGCGSPSQPEAPTSSTTQNPTVSSAAPATDQNQAQQTPDNVAAIASQKEAQLPALPADSKQAIDTEISSINSDISATTNSTNSTDLSNANLGL